MQDYICLYRTCKYWKTRFCIRIFMLSNTLSALLTFIEHINYKLKKRNKTFLYEL
ncbi:Uncharacterized protein dnl_17470 [Desulfonema limicola]|uniref:Uncharacterized protein n=1 Tax=Desulfonema limicola TaxID=45656 RepID=A0A975B638_9BACT|nr:Uncharacterized protein dnl_17470 [Desulfonema limicola]